METTQENNKRDASVEVHGSMKSTSKHWFNNICKKAIRKSKLTKQKWLGDKNNSKILERYKCNWRKTNNIPS